MEARFRLRLGNGTVWAVGPGKVALLEAIAETGSISAAGRKLHMSYRRAWMLVDEMNRQFRAPVIASSAGGRAGGGTEVTALGREVIERYRRIEQLALAAGKSDIAALAGLLSP